MKRRFLLPVTCLCLLIVSTGTSAAIDRERSQTFYESGLTYFRGDQLTESIIELRNALQQDPENLPARILLGEALLRDGDPEAAIKELELGLSMGGDENLILAPLAKAYLDTLQPEKLITGIVPKGHNPDVDGELHLMQGEAYMMLGNPKLADESFTNAVSLNPGDVRPLIGRARVALGRNKRNAADKYLAQAVGLDPDSFDLWLFKALLHRDAREPRESLQAFEEALRLRPTSGRALIARAALWIDVANYEAAREDLNKARDLEADTLESLYLHSLLLFREGKIDEAKELLAGAAAEINSIIDDYRNILPKTQLMLGVVAFFQEQYEGAVSHLAPFVKTTPNHLGARRYLASSYAALEEWDLVIKALRPTPLSDPPADPMALSLLAEAYRAKGSYPQAERYYQTALALAPNAAAIGLRLAMSRIDAGKPEEALRDLNWFAERFPEYLEVKIQLARVYLRMNRPEDALAAAKSLIEMHSDDSRAHNTAGTVFLAVGDNLAAREHIRLASAIDPDFVLAQLNLARLEKIEGNVGTSETVYRTILENRPNNVVAGVELTRLLVEQGQLVEAKERIGHIMTIAPENYDAHLLQIQVMQGRREPVEKIKTAAYELQKRFGDEPRAYLVAGRIYAVSGEREEARVQFRHAVEKAEFDTSTLINAAIEQMRISDNTGALWTLTKALQGNPNDARAGALKVNVLTTMGEREKASELIDTLFEQHPDNAVVYSARGDWLRAENRIEESVADYRRAFELRPTSHSVNILFNALAASGQFEKAFELADQWVAENRSDYGFRLTYAQMLMAAKRDSQARDVYEALQRDGIQPINLLNNLAVVYQRLNDNRALKTAEQAYKAAPESAGVLDTYGWILAERGNPKEGLAILREAYARSSTIPEIRYHIGLALIKLGKNSEAINELEASLAINDRFPGSDNARELVGELKRNGAVN